MVELRNETEHTRALVKQVLTIGLSILQHELEAILLHARA